MFDYNEGYAQDSPFFSMFIFLKGGGVGKHCAKNEQRRKPQFGPGVDGERRFRDRFNGLAATAE